MNYLIAGVAVVVFALCIGLVMTANQVAALQQTRVTLSEGETVLCKRVTAKIFYCRKLEAM